MAYIILVENDGSLYGSHKTKIMQREKLFNKLWFLVPPHYNGHDMSQCTVTMRYLLPISREFVTETLILSDERYEEYLKYILPIDTNFTKEHGNIELNLTFTMLDVDNNGNVVQRVRKTDNYLLNVTPLPDWDSVIPDSSLSALDQRILKQDAQIKALADLAYLLNDNQVDNLVYDSKEDVLHLSAKGVRVGNKVSVKDFIDDGIPVVDLDSNGDSDSNTKPEGSCDCGCEHEDNVVEFGDLENNIVEKLEDDNVVEF
jgi:hypothetical protein